MRTELFDFELPEDRIALEPVTPRDAARLLVVGDGGGLLDRVVRDLPDLLRPGDALVLNDTRVIPAAISGTRTRAGNTARVAFNLIKRVDERCWRAFARPAKRLDLGDEIRFEGGQTAGHDYEVAATVAAKGSAGEVDLVFNFSGAKLDAAIGMIGTMPLPPYIALKRKPGERDADSYQTIYARREGAVAAPTAGLHFTPDLMARLEAGQVNRHFVTLHVGAGTFLPVKVEDTAEHVMHAEWGEITEETAATLNAVRRRGGRIVAGGTTALRLLESAATADGIIHPYQGETSIFITPGYRFKAVNVLMTNFHLPRSTLFMLVSAFAGLEPMRAAYVHAVANGYRFYSYGDATLLFRAP